MRELNALSEAEQRLARRKLKQRFKMILANISRVQIYWSPTKHASSRARPRGSAMVSRLPDDATLIGTYQHPFNGNDFLDDLDDVLRRLALAQTRTATACAG
jgi:hypothetical protein